LFTHGFSKNVMTTTSEIAIIAQETLNELNTARAAGEDVHGEHPALGPRLRRLLTMTDSSTGPMRRARLKLLTAIGRTEVSDEMRRGGTCHTGIERSVRIPADADLNLLVDGLRQLAQLSDHAS
jgi:hypothetical protein